MDLDDSAVEVALSAYSTSFSSYVPLPFRILALLSFAILCWAVNLHVLHLLGIDTSVILDVRAPGSSDHIHPSKLYPPVYQLAAFAALWTTACWVLGFQVLANGQADSSIGRVVAAFSWGAAVIFLFAPVDKLKRQERLMFIRSLKRTAFDTIFRPVPFCDVILADILTSFAKVLGDLWVCLCMFVSIDDERGGWKEIGVPFMIALPYVFRLRQCISEYLNTPWESPANSHGPTSMAHSHQPSIFIAPASASSTPASPKKRALFNALKYASAFPVIAFSAMQGKYGDPHHLKLEDEALTDASQGRGYFSANTLFRIWVMSVLINSFYSFWWDVTNDFGLHFLLPSRRTMTSNTPLRRILLLPDPLIYYLIIALDFFLRCTWSLKLSSHLHSIHEMEMGIFLLEALEVLRRWLWVFVRIEWEAVRKGGDGLEERLRHGPSGSSISLLPTSTSGSRLADVVDRRVSASHRKPLSKPAEDSGSDGEIGLGRSGVLVEKPESKEYVSSKK